ncbi:class I glutamine amidotransferase-like protein [Aspergillus avenaceus]|uniref:Class I glutamine amidotransferase-like protein n=1 Tax=Aspergillus avenaceus TaxID=36643 RepID=A0A5N6U479_ASPAV|nr:class I glutamine amidotransferase-like protein [Aspergillus avenaceus]
MSYHIAILDADVPQAAAYQSRGFYSSQFRTLLQAAAGRLSSKDREISIFTSSYDLTGGSYPPLESLRTTKREPVYCKEHSSPNPLAWPIDGILITGGAPGAYETDKYPWIKTLQSFIETVYREYPYVKFFGSCFGHQILAQALLSESAPQCPAYEVGICPRGFEVGVVPITLSPEFVSSFPSLMEKIPGPQKQLRLQMIHGDWVIPANEPATPHAQLPPGWVNVGWTEMCPFQGFYQPSRVLTYQGHFEFDRFVNHELCLAFSKRLGFPKDLLDQYLVAIERGVEGDDSKVAAEAVVMFFCGLS